MLTLLYFSRLFCLCDIGQATNLFRIRCFYLSLAELEEEKISLGWSEKALGKRLDFSLALKGTSGWLHQCSWLSTQQQCSFLYRAGLKVGKPWWRLPRRESYWVKTKLALLIAIWPAYVPGPGAYSLVLFCLQEWPPSLLLLHILKILRDVYQGHPSSQMSFWIFTS